MAHRFTKPLLEAPDGLPVYSAGYHLIELVDTYTPLRLYNWQRDLIIRVLEQCPPGHKREGQLRYRKVVISMARQNGKSVIASVLALYGLLQHSVAPRVLGVASTAEQAGIVYEYTSGLISDSDALTAALKARGTATLGISRTDERGQYVVRTSKSNSLQGYPSTLAIVDELHILDQSTWNAIVKSQTAQTNPLIIGITTAGDINSVLLKRLYTEGDAAIAGGTETFGFFVWEADSDEFTLENITQANPNVIEGIKDVQEIYDDELYELPADQRRFTLNRFVEGLAEPWIPVEDWASCAGTGLTDFKDVIYAIEVSEGFKYATISAYRKDDDNTIRKALVARLVNPDPQALKDWCVRLRKQGRCIFVVDGWKRTRFLADFLEDKGWPVVRIGNRRAEAASITYAAIKRGEVEHDNHGLVNMQHATARTKAQGEDFVVISNGSDIDAAYADVFGIYAAETIKRKVLSVA